MKKRYHREGIEKERQHIKATNNVYVKSICNWLVCPKIFEFDKGKIMKWREKYFEGRRECDVIRNKVFSALKEVSSGVTLK